MFLGMVEWPNTKMVWINLSSYFFVLLTIILLSLCFVLFLVLMADIINPVVAPTIIPVINAKNYISLCFESKNDKKHTCSNWRWASYNTYWLNYNRFSYSDPIVTMISISSDCSSWHCVMARRKLKLNFPEWNFGNCIHFTIQFRYDTIIN